MDLIGQGVLLEIDGNQKLTDARTDARTTPLTTIPLSPIRAEVYKRMTVYSLVGILTHARQVIGKGVYF